MLHLFSILRSFILQYARGISYICPNRPTTGFGNVDIRSRIASVSKRQNCYLFPFIYLKSVFFSFQLNCALPSLVVSLLLRKLSSIHSAKLLLFNETRITWSSRLYLIIEIILNRSKLFITLWYHTMEENVWMSS